jgi:hypothetical protein
LICNPELAPRNFLFSLDTNNVRTYIVNKPLFTTSTMSITAYTNQQVQLYNHPMLPGLTNLIYLIEGKGYTFSSWDEYIDVVTSSPDAALLPVGLEPENLDDPKRAWAEQAPLNRNDESLNFLSELVWGEPFDLASPELENNFEDLMICLNSDLSILWNPFVETVFRLNNTPLEGFIIEEDEEYNLYVPIYDFPVTPELIQSFSNHVLLWAYVHNAPLLNPIFT